MTIEVQSHLLTGYIDTCNGPDDCQTFENETSCAGKQVTSSQGIAATCTWGIQGEGETEKPGRSSAARTTRSTSEE